MTVLERINEKFAKKQQVNQIIDAFTGTTTVDLSVLGDFSHLDGARSQWVGSGGAARSYLGVQGETDYGALSILSGDTTPDAANIVPLINVQHEVKPNAAAGGLSGASVLLKGTRHGSGTFPDLTGNIGAWTELMVVAYSNSTANVFPDGLGGFNTNGHDVAGAYLVAKVLDNSGIRGGTVNSVGRAYPLYAEGELMSQVGQAFGAEIQVVNSSNSGAAQIEDSGYAKKNFGIQIVSNLNASLGDGLATRASSAYNTAALFITTSDPATAVYAFRRGLVFNAGSIKDYAIDAYLLSSSIIPLRLQTGGTVVARVGSTDAKLFRLESTAGYHDIFLGHDGSGNKSLRFLLQDLTVKHEIDAATGYWKATGGAMLAATTGGAALTLGTPVGGANMPATAAIAGFERRLNAAGQVCWFPYWQ